MRTVFYLTVAIAALFMLSAEARYLRKRAGTGVVGGEGGEPLGFGIPGGVSDAESQHTQEVKEKRDLFVGSSLEGLVLELLDGVFSGIAGNVGNKGAKNLDKQDRPDN